MRPTSTLALLTALLFVPALSAESVSGQMRVSVQVMARVNVRLEAQPAQVVVTSADVKRGYLDLPAPIVFHAQTNSRQGYLLQVSNGSTDFSEVQLSFAQAAINVAQESWIARPYVPGGEVVSMNARLRLSSNLAPGSYPLPISISATPL